ncbi:MAG: hypothetical protein ACRDS0_26535 [Pseudonocardiaceae bacterium]
MLWPVLDRVVSGTIAVRIDEYGWPWYLDDGRHCPFSGYLLDKLVEQGYARWDSMVQGPQGLLVVRDDGLRAVVLEEKGRALHQRLSAGRVLDRERAACSSSPLCGLSAVCGRCGWTTWPRQT